jgi:hypothetical protein
MLYSGEGRSAMALWPMARLIQGALSPTDHVIPAKAGIHEHCCSRKWLIPMHSFLTYRVDGFPPSRE